MTEQERIKKALDIAMQGGGVDGGDHKMYVIDQMVRALCGVPMVTENAIDCKGVHYSYQDQGMNQEYETWVKIRKDGEDGPDTYSWNEGVAP